MLPPGRARLATSPVPTGSFPKTKDDGDDRGRLLYCWGRAVVGNNGIDVEPDELGRDLGDALGASL
jgi:hypothetical protein